VICSRGYDLILWRNFKEHRICRLPSQTWWKGIVQKVRIFRHGLRLGIHNAIPLKDGSFLAIANKRIYKVTADGEWRIVENIVNGNKPAFNGLEVTPSGDVFYAEYSMNMNRKQASRLFRSTNQGETFQEIFCFEPGEVRHIHFVQWDPFENCLWMGTGDADLECRILKSFDNGFTWKSLGSGSQRWRALGLAFTNDSVYWGTDAGLDAGDIANEIIQWKRDNGSINVLTSIQGPCHGITKLRDGTIWFSTGVEGGKNEKDDRVHLWAISKTQNLCEVKSWKKDIWPAVIQISTIHFPHGLSDYNALCMLLMAIKNNPETAVFEEISIL